MAFLDTWQTQAAELLVEAANKSAGVDDTELRQALAAVSVIWPLRQPIQEFDLDAIEAVNQLLGSQAKYALRFIQSMGDDQLAAARELRAELAVDAHLAAAVEVLSNHFRTEAVFASHASGSTVTALPTLSEANRPSRVFISYARKDAEDLARELTTRLEAEGIPVWQDRVKMEGGRDWWLQIVAALEQVDFMILIVTPAAMQSAVVEKEWTYARQRGVCICPVWGSTPAALDTLPRWLRDTPFYQPETEWLKLVADLNGTCATPRVPFMVEEMADDFIPRAAQLQQIEACVLEEPGSIVGLHGAGGYGKTILAKAICHDATIRAAYDDGILWVTLGRNPGDLASRVIDLIEVLSGERPYFAAVDEAQNRLVQLLGNREILIVIDDVWNAAHLKPFLKGGSRCARLITTRDAAVLPPRTRQIEVSAMTATEAIDLLRVKLPNGLLPAFPLLADRLGNWPLLLKLTNSTLRDRVFKNNQSLEAALTYVNKALNKRGLTAFDIHNTAARDQAVGQTLGVSLELLNDEERLRFSELVIFPVEVNIPFEELDRLWRTTSNQSEIDVEALCQRLAQLSLLAHFEPNKGYITLHKIVRSFLTQPRPNNLTTLHDQFLKAAAAKLPRQATGRPIWSKLPLSETYLWSHLAYHLLRAEHITELAETVKDLSYLVTKIYLLGAYAAEIDLLTARQAAPDDPILPRLHQSISQASHLLNQAINPAEIANTLHSRMVHISGLESIAAAGETQLPGPLLTAARRLPDLPDASLIRTLNGHGTAVMACDISADGSKIVSMGQDGILKVWASETGEEIYTLAGHKIMGNSCAISADGSVIVSATWDGFMKIWDTYSGSEKFSIKAHVGQIFGCAIDAQGTTVVTASKDKTLKVWDATTGQERFTLTDHNRTVTGCAVSPDGALIVSSSSDGTVKLWHGKNGQLQTTIRSYEDLDTHNPAANLTFSATASTLLSCAVSANGTMVTASLPEGVLKVWDGKTGQERFKLRGHTGWIESCTISADGRYIISTSNDKTIKGWAAATGAELFSIEGHQRSVTDSAISADGSLLVTCSQDKTLKLWDVAGSIENSRNTISLNRSLPAQNAAVSADGQTGVFDTVNNDIRVIDYQTGNERFLLKGHMRPVTSLAISSDGAIIVSSSQDRTLRIWDAVTGEERSTLIGHVWAVNHGAISPDGRLIVSASEDSTLKVWAADSRTELFTLTGHLRGVNGCTFSPDGTFIVSASADQTVRIWDAATGRPRLTLKGHTGPVYSCTVSPDNTLIASTSNDNTIHIWHSQSGELHFTLIGHSSSVLRSAFRPNGRQLLSVSKDNTVRLWDIHTSQLLTVLRVDGNLSDCAWLPDGRQLIAVGPRGVYFLELNL